MKIKTPLILALAIFISWTLATFLLEGNIQTFLRPEAVTARILYIVIANFAIGIIVSVLAIRHLSIRGHISAEMAGFRSVKHSLISVFIGLLLGSALYFLQNPPTSHPVIILNAFFQVFSVTMAEILVCWAVIGTSVLVTVKNSGRTIALISAIISSTVLFGLYHYAHSPPFNTLRMVLFLTVIGIFTGIFFFISRNVYGTMVFHNFFGITGVIAALDQADKLQGYRELQPPVMITALVGLLLVILLHRFALPDKPE